MPKRGGDERKMWHG